MVRARYFARFHKMPNLKDPQDLNEKILYLKLYSDTSKWTDLADKYEVRKYVEKLGLGDTLVKLYGVWDNIGDIEFDSLPNSLIFKANNGDGTGTNKIVRDLKNANKSELKKLFKIWLSRKNIGDESGDPHYKSIPPKIIAEELLSFSENIEAINDYKIWCINGKPRYIFVCQDRDPQKTGISIMNYDTNWNPHPETLIFSSDYKKADLISKPKNMDKMLEIATKLSAEFPIVRVDLYNIDGKIYFGELTFTSMGGYMPYFTKEFLLELGKEAIIS
ncbi:MAG: hypothetical protein J1E95_07705 [Muribaculaceae bacterium]|nr:hypothetical protein [Muribaculaceae bacterium]